MISILLILFNLVHASDMIKIAVVDTGLDFHNTNIKICDNGHADFTGNGMNDVNGHGSNVSAIIDEYAGDTKHCQIIIKYYNKDKSYDFVAALKYAIKLKPDIINVSSTGTDPSPEERAIINKALSKHIIIIAAAGNEGKNLDINCNFYPVCYKGVIGVGNLINPFRRNPSSNYGKFLVWEIGTNITAGGKTLSGTSQSTAVLTGKLVKEIGIKRGNLKHDDN